MKGQYCAEKETHGFKKACVRAHSPLVLVALLTIMILREKGSAAYMLYIMSWINLAHYKHFMAQLNFHIDSQVMVYHFFFHY